MTTKKKIKKAILRYFKALKEGEQFYGSAMADYCTKKAGSPHTFPATVLRYMREMKAAGELDFKCLLPAESLYEKIGS